METKVQAKNTGAVAGFKKILFRIQCYCCNDYYFYPSVHSTGNKLLVRGQSY